MIQILQDGQSGFSQFGTAIVGAGVGGCATAFFLEEVFANQKVNNGRKHIAYEIDLFEKNDQLGGRTHKFTLDKCQYELTVPSRVLASDVYMNYFLRSCSHCPFSSLIRSAFELENRNTKLAEPYKSVRGRNEKAPAETKSSKLRSFFGVVKLLRQIWNFTCNRFK